jgi:predicted TIM-barrel fold metal-dependent hydrolase
VEIIDAQVHIPRLVVDARPGHPRASDADAPPRSVPGAPAFEPPDRDVVLTATLLAMDAAGVDAVVIDEWLGQNAEGRSEPGVQVSGGGRRWDFGFSKYAVERYPERFSFLARAHPLDPDLDAVVDDLAATPGMRTLRLDPLPWLDDLDLFARGGYAPVVEAARRHGLPIMVWSNGPLLGNLEQYLERFGDVQFILDHLGTSNPRVGVTGSERFGEFDTVFELGRRFGNLALKLSTVESQSAEVFPYRDVWPYIERALDVFGRERLMWASDWSEHRVQQSWAQSHLWVQAMDQLSGTDREWLLGRTARTLLRWPAVGDTVGRGLYFDCAATHPSIRISGVDEGEFETNMRAHLDAWHPHQVSREQLLARARR